jgi:hypothetical protein
MYKLALKLVITLLIISLTFVSAIPLVKAASVDYVKIDSSFTFDPNQPGFTLQPESTIYQLNNGVTEVYGPDGNLQLKTIDSQCSIVHLPDGRTLTANRVYCFPSGCLVIPKPNGYDILNDKVLLLTVVNVSTPLTKSTSSAESSITTPTVEMKNVSSILPFSIQAAYPNSFIEQANDWNGPTGMAQGLSLTDFSVNYVVPLGPPSNTNWTKYFWNGLQSLTQGLIQPVLEWAQTGNSWWTASDWYLPTQGDACRFGTMNVTPQDICHSWITYDQNTDIYWTKFKDLNTGNESDYGILHWEPLGLVPLIVYEGGFQDKNVNNDINSPRDCAFYNISTLNFGNQVAVHWLNHYDDQLCSPKIDQTAPLSGLAVVGAYQGSTQITLRTTYTPALSVLTNAPTNIAPDWATLNGNLNGLGSANNVQVSFEWGPTNSYGNATAAQNMTAAGTFSSNTPAGQLSPNTTYHYAAEVQGNGTIFGSDQIFTTGAQTPVITDAAATITATSAILNARITNGSDLIRGFVIDTTSHPSTPSGAFDTHVGTGGYDLWRWYEKPWYSLSNPWQMMSDLMCTGTISSTDLTFFGLQYGWTMPYPLYYRGDTCESGGTIGSRDLTELGYYYGTTVTYTPFSPGSFSVNLASPHTYYNGANHPWGSTLTLTSGTTYYYRAFAYDSSNGWTWGNEVSFTTN